MAPVTGKRRSETYASKNARRRMHELIQQLQLFLKNYLRHIASRSISSVKPRAEDQCFIQKLPVELLDKIVRSLPNPDKLNLRLVNKSLNDAVCCSLEFRPILNWCTSESFKSFLNDPIRKHFKELLLGDLGYSDYDWLTTSHLQPVQIIRFETQILHQALTPAQGFIKKSTNLRQLDFKEYNLVEFDLTELTEDEEVAIICKQLTHLSIKGKRYSYRDCCAQEEAEEVDPDPPPFHAHITNFNCEDLAKFTSLQSLELLKMGHVYLTNVASLPTTLKQLQLFTIALQRPELTLLIERLVNLERLLIQSNSLNVSGVIEDEQDFDVPLGRDLFETMVVRSSIKFLHYTPIFPATVKRFITTTSLTGSNIVQFKFAALKQTFTAVIKRQVGYKRK